MMAGFLFSAMFKEYYPSSIYISQDLEFNQTIFAEENVNIYILYS